MHGIAYIPINYAEQRKKIKLTEREIKDEELRLEKLKTLADKNTALFCNYELSALKDRHILLVIERAETVRLLVRARRDGKIEEEAKLKEKEQELEKEIKKIEKQINELKNS